MWTRSLLKDNAKLVLKRTYWRSFLVCLVMGLLIGGGNAASSGVNAGLNANGGLGNGSYDANPAVVTAVLIVLGVVLVGAVVYALFVGSPIIVGAMRYFMEARGGNAPFKTLFSVFGKPGYGNVVKTFFLMNLRIFLWSLLLIIPGIIKSYQYFFVSYIMAERPDMSPSRALELSKLMTDGEKWNIFVLGLSFIGWEILCIFTCGIGLLFLTPYIYATHAELYTAMRTKIISEGKATEQELPGFIAYP